MDKKILVSAIAVAVICGLALVLVTPLFAVPLATPKELRLP